MPSAISSESEPVDTVSTSIEALFLPRRMIEPLPKARSICESAASSAFVLSMGDPSTSRSAGELMRRSPYGRDSPDRQRICRCRASHAFCTRFVLGAQYLLLETHGVLAPFHPSDPF